MLGLIGKKVGMTQVFDDKGRLTPVTVIKVEGNVVVAQRTEKTNGYNAAVLGSGDVKATRTTKPYAGQFKDGTPKKTLMEFRDYDKEVKVGDVLGVDLFNEITFVDVTGTSKGKGFAGTVKRHNFIESRNTHGFKGNIRRVGSIGSMYPQKVFKGKKMPGRMGHDQVTVKNLVVAYIDKDNNLIGLKGAVPGPKKGIVTVEGKE